MVEGMSNLTSTRKFMPGNFLTLEAVGRFVLYWLLGADP
jgi:hypothetical protein